VCNPVGDHDNYCILIKHFAIIYKLSVIIIAAEANAVSVRWRIIVLYGSQRYNSEKGISCSFLLQFLVKTLRQPREVRNSAIMLKFGEIVDWMNIW